MSDNISTLNNNILIDTMPLEYEILEEGVAPAKKLKLRGLFHKADVVNGNNRKYRKTILEREVQNLQEAIKERRALGELGHPQTVDINLERVSHIITSLEFKNETDVIGTAEVLRDTPYGAILEGLLKNKVKLGISARGKGSVINQGGIDEVADDYQLITFDIVARPSTPGAYPEAILEQKNLNKINNKKILEFSFIDFFDAILNYDVPPNEIIDFLIKKNNNY
jgi:hypothetical protein